MNRDDSGETGISITATAPALKLVLVYAVFASLWILFSDQAVGWLFHDPDKMVIASTLKGWFFVAVTSLLLYGVVWRLLDNARTLALREIEASLQGTRAQQLLEAVADSSTDAIFAKDLQGR